VAKATVLKQSVTVPDYWNGQLTTSSVILADSVEPRTSAASPQEAVEKPYLIGNTRSRPPRTTSSRRPMSCRSSS